MNNHIIRSKWNYQYNRRLSFRFIGQYDSVLANPAFTFLETTRNFNADFLITYLLHPGTAFYVGYNSNLENVQLPLGNDVDGNLLHSGRLKNDGRGLFVKASYLFRFYDHVGPDVLIWAGEQSSPDFEGGAGALARRF